MLKSAQEQEILSDKLAYAIIYHDIIYDPMASDNELKSAELFLKHSVSLINSGYTGDDVTEIYNAILETKTHESTFELSDNLAMLDLEVLVNDLETFIKFERKIFKEYQFVPYDIYKKERIKILYDLGVSEDKISYVETYQLKIGLYPGTFNPFHVGHLNILLKAEKIFDKVIILRGNNPDKGNKLSELPKELKYREVTLYDGMLTVYI